MSKDNLCKIKINTGIFRIFEWHFINLSSETYGLFIPQNAKVILFTKHTHVKEYVDISMNVQFRSWIQDISDKTSISDVILIK